ncbi:transport and Golgi organization protein 1 homolog [Scomber japonicus]|uniref:transport and Golgi organization protein 1 homolog n=1 Tax=Scomber japonicus TaxID=13676 RepID=UPI0023053E6B|nr:transport and Golgi organization protein 1 homolog [Scomber japonicus]
MAAKHFYRKGFLLLLFNFISTAALEKRFSDFKRCADEECSMLLCRGKAVTDFKGPDCRFLSFKTSETVYVYYKLSGRRADMWAGSVGNQFGYFPKDLLAVNHVYTDKEHEIPAEETDFVCFDTGFDRFDNYDVDSLLGSMAEESDSENEGTSEQIQEAEGTQNETKPSDEEATDSEKLIEPYDNSEDLDKVPDKQSASLPQPDVANESPSTKEVEPDVAATPDSTERAAEDKGNEQKPTADSVLETVAIKKSETKDTLTKHEAESLPKDEFVSKNEPVSISEGMQIPKLKTTFGTTFDAVTTDEETTRNVTPYEEEEESENVKDHPEDDTDVIRETPLLPFFEQGAENPASDSLKDQKVRPTTQDDKPKTAEEKNMWTSLGDAVFSVVTGGERTAEDLSSEEDEDDDEDEEEAASKSPLSLDVKPLTPGLPKEPEKIDPVLEDPPNSMSTDSKKTLDSKKLLFDRDNDSDIVEPEKIDPVLEDPPNSMSTDSKKTLDSKKLLFDRDNDSDIVAFKHKEPQDETLKPTDKPIHHQTEASDPISQDDSYAQKSDIKTTDEPVEDQDEGEVTEDSEVSDENENIQDSSIAIEHTVDLDENKTVIDQELAINKTETHQDPSTDLDIRDDDDEKKANDSLEHQYRDRSITDLESNDSQPELSVEEPKIHKELPTEEMEDEKYAEVDEEMHEEKELLEDENALSFSQSDDDADADADEPSPEAVVHTEPEPEPEPEYSDSIMRLTLLRDHFTEENMVRFHKILGLKNLYKVEAMFTILDTELQATRLSQPGTTQDIENALESILESSENAILDEIEKMLDNRDTRHDDENQTGTSSLDEETEILDDFQELSFSLRQKYSTASDSTPMAVEKVPVQDEHELNVKEDVPNTVEEEKVVIPETETDDNLTVTDLEEKQAKVEEEPVLLEEVHTGSDVSVEEDGGHFNKNKDNQPSFTASEELQKVPQAVLEKPLDMGLGVVMEQSPSESLDSKEPVSELHEEEVGLFSVGIVYMGCTVSMIKTRVVEWTVVMISLLPEEWRPGETLFGCPWQAVVITAFVGVVTFTLFFWRTVLAVKKREYLVDEKRLIEQMEALKKEKSDALTKMAELQKQTEKLKENQKQSEVTVSSTKKRLQDLESKVLKAETRNEQMTEEKDTYAKLLKEERENALQNETRIEKLEKSNEKLQLSRKKIQEALSKTTVLLDESKIREDARNVQHKSLEKDYATLKEENKTLKSTIKTWEDKHKELSEQIKVYQKSQKELEDSVVLKDHNVEVLSELLSDLDACDLQKGDSKVNGEVAADKKTAIKNRIKQMMDVSRVQTTLTVVEEERDRFMTKLLNEEKSRKALEEQHQELEHAIATMKSEKSHLENQFQILQQKNEIMIEMYQQKENALQQRLTKEELERRSKESMLSEVGGKAVEAEEQVKLLRHRINEMEEQMKKTEEVYKEQIKEQENKTHSNWVNARNAERALSQEKLESSKLREKLAVLTSQLNERRAPLFRPNSGQPAGPRQGDSYGPSPVSGGAPSPPLMIEGPRRPPSAPVGRRIDPYGPRPPSDPHGRYPDNKHIPGMDMMGPRSSSPANMDGSGPGSFLASPIRDSPGPGPHEPMLPPGPHGRLPPPGPYRPPRPGMYHLPPGPHGPNVPPPHHGPPLPANGHPGMPLPGPMGGEFGPRPANGHAFHPRPGPGHVIDPRGPPPPHFRPPPPHQFGPMPLPHSVRGPMGPRPLIPPDMRFPGPRDHPSAPMDLPPGVPPHPGHGVAYGQAPPDALHNSAGAHTGPGQDRPLKQEASQDSARAGTVKP